MFLVPGTPVDRALARLRSGGQRLAVVGTSERPEGLVTLKDVLEEISGDLAGW
jgi:CBS domain containing-hemolysin-like protein